MSTFETTLKFWWGPLSGGGRGACFIYLIVNPPLKMPRIYIIMRKKFLKFNKRKHRIEGWMTNELLSKDVRKNELYVKWETTSLSYMRIMKRLKQDLKIVRTDF